MSGSSKADFYPARETRVESGRSSLVGTPYFHFLAYSKSFFSVSQNIKFLKRKDFSVNEDIAFPYLKYIIEYCQ